MIFKTYRYILLVYIMGLSIYYGKWYILMAYITELLVYTTVIFHGDNCYTTGIYHRSWYISWKVLYISRIYYSYISRRYCYILLIYITGILIYTTSIQPRSLVYTTGIYQETSLLKQISMKQKNHCKKSSVI